MAESAETGWAYLIHRSHNMHHRGSDTEKPPTLLDTNEYT